MKRKTIHRLFQEQLRRTPHAIALIDEEEEISYHELELLRNKIANYLLRNNCKQGQRIVVKLENSRYLIAALLAIKSIGCVYISVDAAAPLARVNYIMQDSEAVLFFDENLLKNKLDEILRQSGEVLFVEQVLEEEYIECIIYTSGSTGNPKGVKINSAGVVNRLNWMWKKYPFKTDEVSCVKTSIGFVDHIWEIFGPLLKGVPSVLIKKKELIEIPRLIEKLARHHVSRIVIVPSLLNEILQYDQALLLQLEKLNIWSCSGEELKYELVEKFYETFQSHEKRLLNIYGSTEVTADATCFDTYDEYNHYRKAVLNGRSVNASIPIGKPIDNVRVYILDEALQPVSGDAMGEICVSGACLSSGYIGSAIHQFCFVDHPFIEGEKLYRTGDYGRWLPGGDIAYAGRKDAQVKINGYRIDLGEIEQALLQVDGIKQACIVVKETRTRSSKYLIAYWVGNKDVVLDSVAIRNNLLEVLPAYMVPRYCMQIVSFPLNGSGKIDRLALPEPDPGLLSDEYVEPATETEKSMCAIWQDVLGLERVGITDEFFKIGGNSLLAIQASHRMSKVLGYDISVADVFQYKIISQLLRADLVQARINIPAIDTKEAELSFAQERLWFIEQYEQGTNAYHLPLLFELDEDVHFGGVKFAIQQIVSRHEVLRSTIEQGGDQQHGIQKVHDQPLFIEEVVLADNDSYQSLLQRDINSPFDLSSVYPVRVKLYTIESEARTVLLINMHHIASDGWSLEILQRELIAYYEAYINQQSSTDLPTLQIQYKDYANWQRSYLTGSMLETQVHYWKQKLLGYQPLELPTDHQRPAKINYRGAVHSFAISETVSQQLRVLAKQLGVTMHSVLLSSINILLGKYTGQNDIVTGGVIANRQLHQTEGLIGFFVNTRVNRTLLDDAQNYEELIQQVHQEQIQSQLYQDLPFEKLVQELIVSRDLSRHPIFQVMFEVQDVVELNKTDDSMQTYFTPLPATEFYSVEKFDLSIMIDNREAALRGQISYATALFCKETIDRLANYYIQLLTQLAAKPAIPYSEHSLLSNGEYNQIVNEWNATNKEYPKNKTVCDLFQEQVSKSPDNVAVVFGKQQLTYAALNAKSNQLARHIRQQYRQRTQNTLRADTLIALYLDRGLEMVIGILAVMKSGAAYVPMDIHYPQDRIDFILENTQAAFILSQHHLDNSKVQLPRDKVIEIDLDAELYQEEKNADLLPYAKSTDLAYVIYTSGTTGKPKGVMVEHAAFAQFIYNFRDYLSDKHVGASCNVLSLTNYVFDIFGLEYALPLITGNKITVSSLEKVTAEEIAGNEIIQQTPNSLLQLAMKYADKLSDNICLVGGEALLPSVAKKLIQSFKKVFNVYGPAETVIWSTAYEVNGLDRCCIGKPLFNEQVYVLDKKNLPVPVGVNGELYIGGAGVARGYLNRPDLTKERFIANSFLTETGKAKGYTRLYKTGDVVRWLSDGNLEFIGRYDDQVKIRGHRIELGEIEHTLLQIAGIRQACVLAKERKTASGSNKYLVAYYVADRSQAIDEGVIKSSLSKALPDYMMPDIFIEMDLFPLTVNGKLDKAALPTTDMQSSIEKYIAPTSETEKQICTIWENALQVERVSIADDFFKIGGDSIISIQVSNLVSQLGPSCEVKDIFECRTIETLAAYLNKKQNGHYQEQHSMDWNAECKLDLAIVPTTSFVPCEPASIFLTGATGFVGAYLLAELLQQTNATIYCLVRAGDKETAMKKLRQNLTKYRLWVSAFESRIIPVVGTLSEPMFGWHETQFHQLAAKIDVIYHNAAWVNLAYPYQLLKPANVHGTAEILRFACCKQLKQVHHISTFSVFCKEAMAKYGKIDETTPLDVIPVSSEGYSQSKWVAEQLMMEAQKRGVPVTIYRLGHVTGDGKTGISQTSDMVWNQVKSCIQLEMAPVLDEYIDLTPVDFVSKAIVYLSRKPEYAGRAFHLINKDLVNWRQIFEHVQSLGYPLNTCTRENWREEIQARIQQDNKKSFLTILTNEIGSDNMDMFSTTQTQAALNGIGSYSNNSYLLDLYLNHFIHSGFLEPAKVL